MSYYYSEEEPSYSFGQNPNFQSFDYGQQGQQQYTLYGGESYMAQAPAGPNFEDEPPLLEELGINLDHVVQKTRAVLNPFRITDAVILRDTDLAGPLMFCLAFGSFLLLSGKVHFGYIYGIGVVGCVGMYFLLNAMSVSGVSIGVTISVLGYCLLPMVGLAGVSAFVSLKGVFGLIGTFLSISWCALSASKLFVTALGMEHQQPLIAYPCALLYGIFALLTVF